MLSYVVIDLCGVSISDIGTFTYAINATLPEKRNTSATHLCYITRCYTHQTFTLPYISAPIVVRKTCWDM